jgi:2-methylaconitate cis-trans-isomerase PrpF
MTGSLFPTGSKKQTLQIPASVDPPAFDVTVTLIDVANPFIFVDAKTLPAIYHQLGPAAPQIIDLVETIRREGAVIFGLAKDTTAASLVRGTPKIAILSPPKDGATDISVMAYSMGKPHPTLQLTGAVCLGAAVCIEGTIAHELSSLSTITYITPPTTPPRDTKETSSEEDGERTVRIKHAGGVVAVAVKIAGDSEECNVEKVTVSRTARRLFEGNVFLTL